MKILAEGFRRKKSAAISTFLFVLLSTTFMAGSADIAVKLISAVEGLSKAARIPDYTQYATTKPDSVALSSWSGEQDDVVDWQVVPVINVPNDRLLFGNGAESDPGSNMEASFVVPGRKFDILLGVDNRALLPRQGTWSFRFTTRRSTT